MSIVASRLACLVLCQDRIEGCQGQLACPCFGKGGQAAHGTRAISPRLTEHSSLRPALPRDLAVALDFLSQGGGQFTEDFALLVDQVVLLLWVVPQVV